MWWQRGVCGIVLQSYLPPIRFSPSEALNVFVASRLMAGYAQRYDPDIASIFSKLNCILPSPLKDQVEKTIEWMNSLPKNTHVVQTLGRLAEAWISGYTVHISYQSYPAKASSERDVDVYYIQPVSIGHSAYVIGYCHKMKKIRTFKVERIESIALTPRSYGIPRDFDANKYLSSAWGIVTYDKVETIKLRFVPELARLVEETLWHPSQTVKRQNDGSAVMTLKVAAKLELVTWILGWGEKVEVLDPKELRAEVARIAKKTAGIYMKHRAS